MLDDDTTREGSSSDAESSTVDSKAVVGATLGAGVGVALIAGGGYMYYMSTHSDEDDEETDEDMESSPINTEQQQDNVVSAFVEEDI